MWLPQERRFTSIHPKENMNVWLGFAVKNAKPGSTKHNTMRHICCIGPSNTSVRSFQNAVSLSTIVPSTFNRSRGVLLPSVTRRGFRLNSLAWACFWINCFFKFAQLKDPILQKVSFFSTVLYKHCEINSKRNTHNSYWQLLS